MSKIDYAKMAETAVRLIDKAGTQSVVIISKKTTNQNEPWKVDNNQATLVPITCVFLRNREKMIGRTLAKEGDLSVVASPTKPSLTEELVVGNALILRGTEQWKVVGFEVIKPTDIELVYKFLLRK